MAEPVEQDNMLIEWGVEIVMDDGLILRADVFQPKPEGKWPVLLTYGPYAKGLASAGLSERLAEHDRKPP